MLNFLLATMLLALPTDSVISAGQLRGRVVDGTLDRPLPAAVVRLSGSSVRRMVTTGMDGSFVFPDLPAGAYALRVDRDSYQSSRLSLVVPVGREVVVDVQLTRRPSELRPVVVMVEGVHGQIGDRVTLGDTSRTDGGRSLRALDLLSQSGNALASILGSSTSQAPPQGGGKSHTLFVWGTNDESGRVLLDGATLSAPLHLGGLMPTMDPELIDDARIRTGGTSARFDGGTGYVLELSTRDPTPGSLRTWGESDLLADRAGAEVPLGANGSVLAGARRVREGMLSRLSGAERAYGYGDLLTRMSFRTSERGHLAATFFGTSESIRIPRDQGSDQAEWRNRAGSIAWQTGRPASRSAVRLAMTGAMMDLPLLSATGGHLRADVDRATAAVDHQWDGPRWQAGVGGEVERVHFGRATRITSAGSPANSLVFPSNIALGATTYSSSAGEECGITGACAGVSSSTTAIFGDFGIQVAPRLRLSTGLRFVLPFGDRAAPPAEVLPRVALEALLAPRTTLRLSAGGFSQLGAAFSDSSGGAGNLPDGGIPQLEASLVRNLATHAELALAHQWGRAALGISAFAHRLRNEPRNTSLRGAAGIDASWAFVAERVSASASYSLIRRTLDSALAPTGAIAASNHTFTRGEHLVSANVEARASRARLTLSGAYVRGLPFSSIVLDRPTTTEATGDTYTGGPTAGSSSTRSNAPPDRPFVRLDATLSSNWCLGQNGCRYSLAPYVRLINALDRRDALFYYHDGGVGRPLALAAFPAIVSVGIKWEASRAKR